MITNNKHYSTNNLNIINSSPSINTIPQNIQLLSNQPSNVSNHNTISPYNIQDLISLTTLNTRGLNESIKLKSRLTTDQYFSAQKPNSKKIQLTLNTSMVDL
jgi:hypothetical protein